MVKISLSELTSDVEKGMKRKALAEKYTNGNNAALTRMLKEAKLKIRKFKTAQFELVDDREVTTETIKVGFTKEEEEKMYAEAEELKREAEAVEAEEEHY